MISTLAILALLFLGHAAAQSDLQACPSNCIQTVFSNPAGLGCAAGDQACACKAGINFTYAIRDCVTQSCTEYTGDTLTAQIAAAESAAQADCAVATSSVLSSPTPSPVPPVTTTTPVVVATTSVKASSPTSPVSSAATSTSATTTISAATTLKTSITSVQSSNASKTSISGAGSSATSSSTSSDASSSTMSDANSTEASSSSDLSVAAKAGIGAGAGVALILAAIIFCYILSKKRKAKSQAQGNMASRTQPRIPTMQISRPLPGSGRQYANDMGPTRVPAMSTHFSSQQARLSPSPVSSSASPKSAYAPSRPSREDDHEHGIMGRRYEDMIPRTQPRTMV